MQKTILVADDDDDVRSLVCSAIEYMGHVVVTASDGERALSLCKEIVPDLVILDMMMPGKLGTEVCEVIKKREGGEHLPVMILTARDGVQDKISAFDLGADDYLTKPFNFHELQARVKALLRVRELNLRLQEKNQQLAAMQDELVRKERQLVVDQLAGTTAHKLGQPLSAIILNCHILESLPPDDPRVKRAILAIKDDSKRMVDLIEKIKVVDAQRREEYYGKTEILDIPED